MATIVTRAGKGAPLTNTELDANFTNLNTELGTKLTSADLAPYLTSSGAASLYLPLAGGTLTGDLTFSGSNRRIIGDFTSTTRLLVQTSSANSNTVFGLIPNGTSVNSQFHVWGAADITNAPLGAFTINSGAVQIQSTAAGTGTALPFRVLVSSTEVFRATTGTYNLLIGSSTDDGVNKLQVTGSVGITTNLNFAGTGNRITGDFSNTTVASRAAFQSSTINGNTLVNLLPNGSATVSRWGAFNGADPANSSVVSLGITSSAAEIVSTFNGTGSYLPLDFYTGGSNRGRVSTAGNWLIGTTTDNGTDKLQVNGSVSATSFSGPHNGTVGATTPNTGVFTTLTATADSTFSSTGAVTISKGTTAQQPASPVTGMLRYNTTTNQFEGYSGASAAWNPVGGSTLANDTTTASDLYPTFANATSGTALTLYTGNTKLRYKPSTGEHKAPTHVSTNGIVVNGTTVSDNVTIASGTNGFSVGPVTIAAGKTVTIAAGQRWVIL